MSTHPYTRILLRMITTLRCNPLPHAGNIALIAAFSLTSDYEVPEFKCKRVKARITSLYQFQPSLTNYQVFKALAFAKAVRQDENLTVPQLASSDQPSEEYERPGFTARPKAIMVAPLPKSSSR